MEKSKKKLLALRKPGCYSLVKAMRKTATQVQELRYSFIRNDPSQRLEKRFIWFKKWVLERQTFKTLTLLLDN